MEEMQVLPAPPENQEQLLHFATQYQQLMLLYEGGIKQITTKLDILNREHRVRGMRTPIETVKSRLKTPRSIADKLSRRGLELSIRSILENLNDVAGVRVVCPYISDIYAVRDMLLSQADVTLFREKDYIRHPKPNGYRSLHLVVEVPVYLSDSQQQVRVEIQIRTIAMDFWASLDHQLKYKKEVANDPEISEELKQCADVIARTDEKMLAIRKKIEARGIAVRRD